MAALLWYKHREQAGIDKEEEDVAEAPIAQPAQLPAPATEDPVAEQHTDTAVATQAALPPAPTAWQFLPSVAVNCCTPTPAQRADMMRVEEPTTGPAELPEPATEDPASEQHTDTPVATQAALPSAPTAWQFLPSVAVNCSTPTPAQRAAMMWVEEPAAALAKLPEAATDAPADEQHADPAVATQAALPPAPTAWKFLPSVGANCITPTPTQRASMMRVEELPEPATGDPAAEQRTDTPMATQAEIPAALTAWQFLPSVVTNCITPTLTQRAAMMPGMEPEPVAERPAAEPGAEHRLEVPAPTRRPFQFLGSVGTWLTIATPDMLEAALRVELEAAQAEPADRAPLAAAEPKEGATRGQLEPAHKGKTGAADGQVDDATSPKRAASPQKRRTAVPSLSMRPQWEKRKPRPGC